MAAFGSPVSAYGLSYGYEDTGTVTAAYWPITSDPVFYVSNYYEPEPAEQIFESPLQRRRRLSLEALNRYRREARHFVLRVVSVWQRVVYVSRTCAQSERWRVLA